MEVHCINNWPSLIMIFTQKWFVQKMIEIKLSCNMCWFFYFLNLTQSNKMTRFANILQIWTTYMPSISLLFILFSKCQMLNSLNYIWLWFLINFLQNLLRLNHLHYSTSFHHQDFLMELSLNDIKFYNLESEEPTNKKS